MKSFLTTVADSISGSSRVFVAPNKRALVFLKRELSALGISASSYTFLTIEEFVSSLSEIKLVNKIELIPLLHDSYRGITGIESEGSPIEALVDFYSWGEILLKDFEEIDHYCVNPKLLFKELTDLKEIDTLFDYITEEQKEILSNFWSSFDVNKTEQKEKFLHLWRCLFPVFIDFRTKLEERNIAYNGLLYRKVAEGLKANAINLPSAYLNGSIAFIGFNALTKTEELIISYFVKEQSANVYWDIDGYYFNDLRQEAGTFFREYASHPVLGKTMPRNFINNISGRKINLIPCSSAVAQSKVLGELVARDSANGNFAEDNLIVLGDEKLLIPTLHSVSSTFDKVNVTMGYPLHATPLASLIESFIAMHLGRNEEGLYHKHVSNFLKHPYIQSFLGPSADDLIQDIVENNHVRLDDDFFVSKVEGDILFEKVIPAAIPFAVERLLAGLLDVDALQKIDRDFVFYFKEFIQKLAPVFEGVQSHEGALSEIAANGFLKLFRQLLKSEKIPFEGSPLIGAQLMGVLESRNLDFKNVFILGLNEGQFPQSAQSNSYIPYSLRRAYNLPTHENRDAMFAYLFYRLLQRSENVYLFYNSNTDSLGQGEQSRFIQQLSVEGDVEFNTITFDSQATAINSSAIIIDKSEDAIKRLITVGKEKGFSPSALNTYLECNLKFFYRYVAGLKEQAEVIEDLDNRVLGDILHKVIELLYKGHIKQTGSKILQQHDFALISKNIDAVVADVFREVFNLSKNKPVQYIGQRLVVKEIVRSFVERILSVDKQYAPFEIIGLERAGLKHQFAINGVGEVYVSGVVDRVDLKDDTLRIVDYKTGKDDLIFDSIESLFEINSKRNKAAFQTLLYSLLYTKSEIAKDKKVKPGLFNRLNLFNDNFKFGLVTEKKTVEDVVPLLNEFESSTHQLLNDLFDKEKPFEQTSDLKSCQYCEFAGICRRK